MDDMPYDRFVMSQIAGDVLGEPQGTGFLVAGPNDIVKGQDELLGLMQRQDELTDIVNATGTTFLGLTTGCARCHNHKFDPISQRDFFAMQAIFAGVEHGDAPLPVDEAARPEIAGLAAELEHLRTQLQPWLITDELREPVNARHNTERFTAIDARFVRFEINQTSGGEPCIDELQVFGQDGENWALASHGTKPSSSGDFEHPLHRLEHINDGRFGNGRSWIASSVNGGWVQLDFSQERLIEPHRMGSRSRRNVWRSTGN
jgi:hypothetical protein